MLCQNCQKHSATVRVTEVQSVPEGPHSGDAPTQSAVDRFLCEICAQAMQLPHNISSKGPLNILQMLKTASRSKRQNLLACASCGMDLEEFRRRGRLGCPKCYEVFKLPVGELLERVHGARQHVGRVPGVSDGELRRLQALAELRHELEIAIREEAYENAARLRDEIQAIEGRGQPQEPV